MPVVIPPAFAEFSFVYNGPSTTGSNPTWTLGVAGDPLTSSGDALLVWLEEDLLPVTSEIYSLVGIKISTSAGSVTQPLTIDGGLAGTPCPPNSSMLVKKVTSELGRTGRGRMYPPGLLRESDIDNSAHINSASLPGFQLVFDNLMAALITDELLPVVLHSGSSDPTPITRFDVSSLLATQRRRLRG